MKKPIIAILLATLGMAAGQAMAESPLLVRVRAVNIDTANKSDAIPGLIGADTIHVSDKTIPELDISYFITPNIAAELILTYPQKHDVSIDALNIGKIGTVKHLPPTLTVQYHFMPAAQFSPYVGAGVNWTTFSKNEMSVAGLGNISLEHDSFGFALQAGVDYKIDKNWSLNLDIKKVQIRSDVYLNGGKVSAIKIDPLLVGFGVGYRF